MATCLVTGGAGFIGSHLVEALQARGYTVRVLDNLVTGLRENVPAGVEFIEGDTTDRQTVAAAVSGCDFVLHQAAMPSVQRSISEPRTSHEVNVDGTFNVLMGARDAGVQRVVYAASSSVYGDTRALPKTEDMPARPLSPYALQKHIGEEYCHLFSQLYGLETVAIRYFNVFGPRQRSSSPYSGVLALFIRAALDSRAPTIFGDGEQTRDFTYIDNVVDGVIRAMEAPDVAGEVINVAAGGRISLNQAWRMLGSIVGPLPEPLVDSARSGDVRHSQASIAKAERLLGYRPLISFDEGLRRTVRWAGSEEGRRFR